MQIGKKKHIGKHNENPELKIHQTHAGEQTLLSKEYEHSHQNEGDQSFDVAREEFKGHDCSYGARGNFILIILLWTVESGLCIISAVLRMTEVSLYGHFMLCLTPSFILHKLKRKKRKKKF